jgi:putative spermidine/putrescine transport system permease protein
MKARLVTAGQYVFLTIMALFLVAPMVVVTAVSLNSTRRMSFPPEHVSLIWYGTFLSDAGWRASFGSSLLIAVSAALLAMSIALPLSYAIWRFVSPIAQGLAALAMLPFMLPAVVLSVVYLIFWGWVGHPGRIEDVVLSHAAAFLAVPLVTVGLGFSLIDKSLVEAARTLGADETAVFRSIILPILTPYIVSGLAFVFVLSLNEYIIAYMVAGFSVETLPIRVFNSLRLGFEPTMCVGATLFMLVTTGVFLLIAAIGDLPRLLGADRSRG